jgi:hypothetical protein
MLFNYSPLLVMPYLFLQPPLTEAMESNFNGLWSKEKSIDKIDFLNTFVGPLEEKDLKVREYLNNARNNRYLKRFSVCVSICAKLTIFDDVFNSWPRQARRQYRGLSNEQKYIKYLKDYDGYGGRKPRIKL